MKPKRDITLYMFSSDMAVNASLSFIKICKRIRMVNPAYRPSSRYQMRLKNKQAERRFRLGTVRR